MELPEPPEPAKCYALNHDSGFMYPVKRGPWLLSSEHSEAMRAYGIACAQAALEAAAKVCDSVDNHANPMTATDCADAIRAIQVQP